MHPLEQIMKCVVRIKTKTARGSGTGTGFLYKATKTTDGAFVPVFLTNKHVIENATEATIIFSILKPDGTDIEKLVEITIDNLPAIIVNHPNEDVDLCAILADPFVDQLVRNNYSLSVVAITPDLLASREFMNGLLPLEQVTMIGYPNGIWDHHNNGAIARRGSIATMPEHDYHGKKQFVVDMACFNGSSGSPVFLANFGEFATRDGSFVTGSRVNLLGILYAGPQHTAKVLGASAENENSPPIARIPNNLGYVIKAEEILPLEKLILELPSR
ncbi:S1 family peptidase [Pseudomonas sp. DCB_BG]|uniref:S1 family peptidase n=1 Tax=Pseudomonas sp. DCB_BG TaxID=2993595 RepID=UPI0022497FD4|nr:serine protease [Pseudomonas sp. DCB_BG]MCX2709046.1 serine protease [Pseudomonas sp. DCB_BG]